MDIAAQITGLANFAMYFSLSIVFVLIFKQLYAAVTPFDEWKQIKEEKNTTAGLTFGSAILGFSIALGGAAKNSISLVDFAIWALVALFAQIAAFFIIRGLFMPKISERIEANELSAGLILAAMNLSVGVLNAACMSY